jgi:hypothetical protein
MAQQKQQDPEEFQKGKDEQELLDDDLDIDDEDDDDFDEDETDQGSSRWN